MDTGNKQRKPKKTANTKKGKVMSAAIASSTRSPSRARERVLVEFPLSLLQRADTAANEMEKNRSELIRTAVEEMLDRIERTRFELELAEAYAANAQMNIELANDFAHIDSEGL